MLAPTGNMKPPGGSLGWACTQRLVNWTIPVVASTLFSKSSTGYIKGDFATVDDNDGDANFPASALEQGDAMRAWALSWNSASVEENSGRPLAASVARMPITTFIQNTLASVIVRVVFYYIHKKIIF